MNLTQLLKYSEQYVEDTKREFKAANQDMNNIPVENLIKLGYIAGFQQAKKDYAINDIEFDISLLPNDEYPF